MIRTIPQGDLNINNRICLLYTSDKAVGDKVSAATTNQSGYLQCRATRVGEDTTLAQIIRMVDVYKRQTSYCFRPTGTWYR